MLALRDQENLLHGHQTAAASKALNQGNRQLNPKTPGNKVPKTPFKVPLNDENNINAFVSGKPGAGKSYVLGDKSSFVTPMGPKSRAPLGQKTTNAKAKALQTPGLQKDLDLGKSKQKSISARKPKPQVSHIEPAKIDVLADDRAERDIEYMPPPVKDLPDKPDDDFDSLDLSMITRERLMENCLERIMNEPEADGITPNERQAMRTKAMDDKLNAIHDARVDRDMDLFSLRVCKHSPECLGEKCKDDQEERRRIEAEFRQKVSTIEKEFEKALNLKKNPLVSGPSSQASKDAASSLSMAKPTSSRPGTGAVKPKFPASLVSGKKAKAPVNPDPKRHASAVRASNTTMGYSKGRVASATLRKTVLPKKEPLDSKKDGTPELLAPAAYIQKYGPPPVGSETWVRFRSYGCFEDEETEKLEDDWSKQMEEILLDGADDDFQLVL